MSVYPAISRQKDMRIHIWCVARYEALTFPHTAVPSEADAAAISALVVTVHNLDERCVCLPG